MLLPIQVIYLHVSAKVSAMAMLQLIKREVCPSGQNCVLSQGDIEAVQTTISKTIDVASDKSHEHGKYNSYAPEQWARIGKYATENGATGAAKHYIAVWGISINGSRLKSE